MSFTPRPVPKRVSGGVVCLMLVMLGVALFAGFDLMGSAESRGPDPGGGVVTRHELAAAAATRDSSGDRDSGALNVADVFVTIGQRSFRLLTAVITKVVTAWWPTALMLDWMEAVHRVWPSIHRLPGASPPQP